MGAAAEFVCRVTPAAAATRLGREKRNKPVPRNRARLKSHGHEDFSAVLVGGPRLCGVSAFLVGSGWGRLAGRVCGPVRWRGGPGFEPRAPPNPPAPTREIRPRFIPRSIERQPLSRPNRASPRPWQRVFEVMPGHRPLRCAGPASAPREDLAGPSPNHATIARPRTLTARAPGKATTPPPRPVTPIPPPLPSVPPGRRRGNGTPTDRGRRRGLRGPARRRRG